MCACVRVQINKRQGLVSAMACFVSSSRMPQVPPGQTPYLSSDGDAHTVWRCWCAQKALICDIISLFIFLALPLSFAARKIMQDILPKGFTGQENFCRIVGFIREQVIVFHSKSFVFPCVSMREL